MKYVYVNNLRVTFYLKNKCKKCKINIYSDYSDTDIIIKYVMYISDSVYVQ